jgi:ferric enterobactin receptor
LTTLTFSFLIACFGLVQSASGQAPAGSPAGQKPAGQKPTGQAPAGQTPAGQKPAAAKQGAPPTFGRAYGKVTDTAGAPMAEVSALLLKSTVDPTTKKKKLVLVKGMETKANGEFDFEDLPIYAPLVLRLSATGYKNQDISFSITTAPAAPGAKPANQASASPYGDMPSFEKDLGAVKLAADIKNLAAATVTAAPPTMKL